MALQVLENNGTFHLQGNLNSSTTKSFIIHFEYIINTVKNIKVNIDKLNEIDQSGLLAFKKLIAIALKKNKAFYLIGIGSNDIYQYYLYSNIT